MTHSTPAPVAGAVEALARRLLWIAFCWNDHNFDDAHVLARREAESLGIKSFDQANKWLAALAQPAPAVAVEAASEDTARLDWLEKDKESHIFNIGNRWYARDGYGRPHRRVTSLRAAIDHARGDPPASTIADMGGEHG